MESKRERERKGVRRKTKRDTKRESRNEKESIWRGKWLRMDWFGFIMAFQIFVDYFKPRETLDCIRLFKVPGVAEQWYI